MIDAAYYLIPFWVTTFLLLRCVLSTYTAILIVALLFGATEVLKAKKTDDVVWRKITSDLKVIGHRGCALNAPENTIASVRRAHELGVTAIEFDITLTADNVPVAFHDSTADRTTDGSGDIGLMMWAEVQKLDASHRYSGPGSFSNERVPHLRDMLAECKKLGMRAFLDMKGSQPLMMAKVMMQMVREFPDLHEWAVVCSFYPQTLLAIKWQLPQFATILTHRPSVLALASPDGPERNEEIWKRLAAPVADFFLDVSIYHFWWYFCGANGFFMQEEVHSIQEVKYWKKRGLDVMVWTVNDADRKSYLSSISIPYITDDCNN